MMRDLIIFILGAQAGAIVLAAWCALCRAGAEADLREELEIAHADEIERAWLERRP